MSKTKLKDRIKKTISNLFKDDSSEAESLVDFEKHSISHIENKYTDSKSSNKIFTFLRQAFLFAPGAVLLFGMSLGITGSIIEGGLHRIPIWAYPVFILSFFMTTFGLSDGRNPRNYFISISSVLFGIFSGVVSIVFMESLRLFVNFVGDEIFLSLATLIWLIPLFTKLWLDMNEND